MSTRKHNWKKLYEEFLTTNMSPSAFAKFKGIPESCTYLQFKKLGYVPDPQKHRNTKSKTSEALEELTLLPVAVIPSEEMPAVKAADSPALSISIYDASIQLAEGFNKKLLKETLEVLKELC